MKIQFQLGEQGSQSSQAFEYQHDEVKRPMALDVLIQAKSTAMPNMAFRYGCRNELCGVCTIEVNEQPRLACRCRVDEGDVLSPLSTLPVTKDFVVERSLINKQLQNTLPANAGLPTRSPTSEEISLNRCIECYGCLSDCPMHERNDIETTESESFAFGNPYTLLKIQQAMLSEHATEDDKGNLLNKAKSLGMESCLECDGCKCQVGISLDKEVITPLLAQLASEDSDF